MPLRNTKTRWGVISIALHWIVVLLFVTLGVVGLLMTEMRLSPQKVQVYALHKSTGLTLLALMTLRLLWRMVSGRPSHAPVKWTWERWAASASHVALYVLLFAMPISGWVYNSASNFPLQYFGLFNLPALVPPDPALKEAAVEVHETLFWIICAVVAVHAGAALWHHFVRRDDTLARMVPGLRDPSPGDTP